MISPQKGKGLSHKALHGLIDHNLLNKYGLFTEKASFIHQGAFLETFKTAAVPTGQRDGLNERITANQTFSIFSICNPKQLMLTDHFNYGDLGRSKIFLNQFSQLLLTNRPGNLFSFIFSHSVSVSFVKMSDKTKMPIKIVAIRPQIAIGYLLTGF